VEIYSEAWAITEARARRKGGMKTHLKWGKTKKMRVL
jgi:hypothetical protein